MAIIDCFTFNGEYDLLEIRLNILNEYVDQFIIVEAPTTFSGLPKPLYFEEQKERYKKWADKIKYFVIDEAYSSEEIKQAKDSPNTKGASHWKREFLQKESIKKALTHLQDEDIVFIGDVDEIWFPEAAGAARMTTSLIPSGVVKLKLKVYTYFLNNRSSEQFWGPIVARYSLIKNKTLNHVRSDFNNRNTIEMGWHFTSMGGYEEVKRKLTDSYTKESYADERVMNNLQHAVEQSQDFLGRGFTYTIDESEWPRYLQNNREKYLHLLKTK